MITLAKYNLKLVKESNCKYDLESKRGNSPDAIKAIAREFLSEEPEEVFLMLTLDTKLNVTGIFEVSRGTVNESMVHPREVFKRAIANNASSIVVAHNHPSGNTTPSNEDLNITKRLKECGDILGIGLLDHIIVGDYCISLKERGEM